MSSSGAQISDISIIDIIISELDKAVTEVKNLEADLNTQVRNAHGSWDDSQYYSFQNTIKSVINNMQNPILTLRRCVINLECLKGDIEVYLREY